MNVLGLETSGAIGSVAACRNGAVLAEEHLGRGMEHGRMLLPLVDRVVRRAGWDKRRDLDLIAVSQGPGSYTGLRVGLTCAKTLAVLLEKPLVGVCSLDVIAENAPAEWDRVLAVLDAKRDEVYAAAYQRRDGTFRRLAGPSVMKPAEALGLLASPVFVMGDGLARYGTEFPEPRCQHAAQELWRATASVVARLGLEAFRAGHRDEPTGMQPIYLRLPEAEARRRKMTDNS